MLRGREERQEVFAGIAGIVNANYISYLILGNKPCQNIVAQSKNNFSGFHGWLAVVNSRGHSQVAAQLEVDSPHLLGLWHHDVLHPEGG